MHTASLVALGGDNRSVNRSAYDLTSYEETRAEEYTMTIETPVHPGEILREDVLAYLGLSAREAASRLGIRRATLSRVLGGQAPLSAILALRLECAGVSTARAWLAMQSAHDLALVRATGTPRVRRLHERD